MEGSHRLTRNTRVIASRASASEFTVRFKGDEVAVVTKVLRRSTRSYKSPSCQGHRKPVGGVCMYMCVYMCVRVSVDVECICVYICMAWCLCVCMCVLDVNICV